MFKKIFSPQILTKLIAPIFLITLSGFTLTSCEEDDQSKVSLKVIPDIPCVNDFEFEVDDETTATPNWFLFTLSFHNPTNYRLIIQKIEASVRYGDETEFTTLKELDPAEKQEEVNEDYFLGVEAGASGTEEYHISTITDKANQPVIRFAVDLPVDEKSPDNMNYYVKFVYTGFFDENTDLSPYPIPKKSFTKTIYFRTKSALDAGGWRSAGCL